MTQNKVKLIGLKKLLLPSVKALDRMWTGVPMRALFGFLSRTSARASGLDLVDFLKLVQLFEDLGAGDLRRVAWVVHERSYRDGEYILEQGQPYDSNYLCRF
jgi:hypothetical protein